MVYSKAEERGYSEIDSDGVQKTQTEERQTYQRHVNILPNQSLSFTRSKRIIVAVQDGSLTAHVFGREFGCHGSVEVLKGHKQRMLLCESLRMMMVMAYF